MTEQRVYTPAQVSEMLGGLVSASALKKRAQRGKVPHGRFGGRNVIGFTAEDVDAIIRAAHHPAREDADEPSVTPAQPVRHLAVVGMRQPTELLEGKVPMPRQRRGRPKS